MCAAAGRGGCSETGSLQSHSVSAPGAPPSSAAEVGVSALTVGAPDHLPRHTATERKERDQTQLLQQTPESKTGTKAIFSLKNVS